MKNLIQEGEVLQYTIPAATTIAAGDVVVVGTFVGVAATGGTTDDVISIFREGVYSLSKAAVTITQGDHLFYDTTNKVVTNVPASAHYYIGKAFEGADSGASTANVVLLPTTNSHGSLTTVKLTTTSLFFSALGSAPASAGATGTLGELRTDGSYIYVATATNTWKRVAIATW